MKRKPTWSKTEAVKDIKRLYKLSHTMIGSGAFGKVFEAESLADPEVKVAIKVLNKKKMNDKEKEAITEEVCIL